MLDEGLEKISCPLWPGSISWRTMNMLHTVANKQEIHKIASEAIKLHNTKK